MRSQWKSFFAVALALLWLMPTLGAPGVRADGIREVIRIGVLPNNTPYQYLDHDGTIQGFHIELFNAIAEELNIEPVFCFMERKSMALEALDKGEVDLLLGDVPPKGRRHISLSDPLSVSSIAMVVSSTTANQLNAGETGLIASIAYEDETVPSATSYYKINIADCYASGFTRVVMSDQDSVFDYLIRGKSDAALLEKNGAIYKLYQMGLQDEYTIYYNNIASVNYTITSLQNNKKLLNRIDMTLYELHQNGEYERLWKKYEVDTSNERLSILKKHTRFFILGAAVILIVLLIFYLWNRTLRQKVKEKVAELNSANEKLMKERDMLEYESGLRSVMLERNPNGIILATGSGNIIQMNRSVQRFLPENVVMGSNLHDCAFGNVILKGREQRLIQDKISFLDETFTQGTGESQRVYQYSLIPLKKKGEDRELLISISDITAKMRETENLMEAEKSRILNTLVSGIAHEIRNPLMVIKNYAQLILMRKGDERILESFASVIPEETDRINRLIEDLIHFSKKATATKQDIDVSEIIESSVRFVQIDMDRAGIVLDADVEKELKIHANGDQMRQVFINVLINARQAIDRKKQDGAMDIQGRIEIKAYARDGKVLITFADNGCGIDKADLKHVTDPFYTTKPDGTGLGMAVSQRHIEDSRGMIQYTSNIGEGTTVMIMFDEVNDEL